MNRKDFFTTGDVSELLEISRATVSRKFDTGILHGKKNPITGERLISRESLILFMQQYDIPLGDLDKSTSKRILVGSNDELFRSMVKQTFFEDERIKIETVESGCDVLIICAKNPPDLIILDDELSIFSCQDFSNSIKQLMEKENIKYLCCLKTYNPDRIMEICADEYIVKDSLDGTDLSSKVATLLGISDEFRYPVTGLDKERWMYVEKELKYRINSEKIVNSISTKFNDLPIEELDSGIMYALKTIGSTANVDRCYVFMFSDDTQTMNNTYEWCEEGINPQIENLQGIPLDAAPWWMAKINRLENIYIPCVDDLPPEAEVEKKSFQQQNIKSLVVVPMVYRKSPVGFIGFDSVRGQKVWKDEDIVLLRTVGDIIVKTLMARRLEEELQEATRKLHEITQ